VSGLGAAGDIRLGRVGGRGEESSVRCPIEIREGPGRTSEDGRQAGRSPARSAAARVVVEVADGAGRWVWGERDRRKMGLEKRDRREENVRQYLFLCTCTV